jgi:hypothetical protein
MNKNVNQSFSAPIQDVQAGLRLLEKRRRKVNINKHNGSQCRIEPEVRSIITKSLKSKEINWKQHFAENGRLKFRLDLVKNPNEFLDEIFQDLEPYEWFEGFGMRRVRGFETSFYFTIYTNR